MRSKIVRSQLITVTPLRGLTTGLLIASVLLCLMITVHLAVRPMRQLYEPLVWHANYQEVPLSRIVADLERDHIIRWGVEWGEPSLKNRRVTACWLLASVDDVLADLARTGELRIEYPVGYHGDLVGPVRFLSADQPGGRVFRTIDLEMERRRYGLE